MKLIFQQELGKVKNHCDIWDEKGNVIYKQKWHMGLKHAQDIVSKDKSQKAKIEKKHSVGHEHIIEIDNETYNVKKDGGVVTDTFVVEPIGWKVRFSHAGAIFAVMDENGETIAMNIERNAVFGIGKFGIEVFDDEKAFFVAALYFAVMDIITMEDTLTTAFLFN